MWEWLTNAQNLKGLGTVVGGLGTAYGAYTQNNMANKMFNLQKDAYDRSVSKENQSQMNLDNAVSSVYDPNNQKKQAQFTL